MGFLHSGSSPVIANNIGRAGLGLLAKNRAVGLWAAKGIDVPNDPADYDALETAVNADYRPRTNFELERVARLVSVKLG